MIELDGISRNLGVGQIWRRLRRGHGLLVRRETVRDIVSILEPARRIEMRKRRSRYILWIDVDVIDNVQNRHCRKAWVNTSYNTVRIGKGTEHVIADVQTLLHLNHDDGFVAVMVGSFNYNQRIERWWGYCRDSMLQYYMDLFKDLQSSGVLQMNKSILNRMRMKNRQRRI